jgi:hypothetical protein
VLELVTDAKQRLDFIFLYFQLPYLPEETCLKQAGPSAAEGPTQAVLGFPRRSPTQVVLYWVFLEERKVPASLSLFLKSEKIPAMLYIGTVQALLLYIIIPQENWDVLFSYTQQ